MNLRLLLTMGLLAAGAGSVQPATAGVQGKAETRRTFAFMAQCTVRREHDLSRLYVLSGGDWKALDRKGKLLVQAECLPKSNMITVASNDAWVGSLAEALIAADGIGAIKFGSTYIAPLTYPEPTPVRTADKSGKPLSDAKIERQKVGIARRVVANTRLRFGECITRREPERARAVLDTQLDTGMELTAIKALEPAMAQCLAAGETVGFDRETVRGAIAVAVYRLANAATSTGASS